MQTSKQVARQAPPSLTNRYSLCETKTTKTLSWRENFAIITISVTENNFIRLNLFKTFNAINLITMNTANK